MLAGLCPWVPEAEAVGATAPPRLTAVTHDEARESLYPNPASVPGLRDMFKRGARSGTGAALRFRGGGAQTALGHRQRSVSSDD